MKTPKVYIYGKHAVAEALGNAPHIVRKVFLAPGFQDKRIQPLIKHSGVPVEPLDPRRVTSQVEGNAPHQGIVALIDSNALQKAFPDFIQDFIPTNDTLLLLLDGVQDPHNVGALIRTAAGFGAAAVLVPSKKQAPLSATTIKASAGMAFRIPLVVSDSIPDALKALKEKGVRIYGLAGDSTHVISDEPFRAPTLLILGNEGAGVSSEVRKLTDLMLSIPMHVRTESLNVAASGAVAMYAWSVRHGRALRSGPA